jgi:hypothetical protein
LDYLFPKFKKNVEYEDFLIILLNLINQFNFKIYQSDFWSNSSFELNHMGADPE